MWAFLFLLPALVTLIATVVFPIFRSFQFSLYRWPLGAAPKTFVGLDNYRDLILNDHLFRRSVLNTVLFTLGSVAPAIVLGLVVALLLNRSMGWGRGVLRTVYFVPYVSSLVAVGFVWRWLLEPSRGLVNTALSWIGVDGPGWLADPSWALSGIILMTVWRDVGFYMVIFLAGLQTIPRGLDEAAQIDGANAWQRFWRITLPLLNPTIVLVTIIGTIYGLQLFTQVQVMTKTSQHLAGGPLDSTVSAVLFIVNEAFRPLEMGYPSAAAILLFGLILVTTVILLRVVRRRFEY